MSATPNERAKAEAEKFRLLDSTTVTGRILRVDLVPTWNRSVPLALVKRCPVLRFRVRIEGERTAAGGLRAWNYAANGRVTRPGWQTWAWCPFVTFASCLGMGLRKGSHQDQVRAADIGRIRVALDMWLARGGAVGTDLAQVSP